MSLRTYHAKRKFDKTPEPKGEPRRQSSKKLEFVVQEHHASRLHYDFRLELDGVLKSWAVPKGPSMNPHDRHLAVAVEDHPFEYRKFEGVIPEGNYGAGTVIIWDRGNYYPRIETTDPEKTLRQELKKGHLTFILEGQKLHGEFALIKMHDSDDPDAWLLIKKGDEFASTKDITKQDTSVISGKRVDDSRLDIKDFPQSPAPQTIKPMLSTLIEEPFNREGWLFEIKWDGYRAIACKEKDAIQLYSRNNLDFSQKYAEITEAVRRLKHDVVLDGEIVVVDENGHPHFERLQNWGRLKEGTLHYYVFDLLWFDGHDIREVPLVERKALLKSILPKGSPIMYSDHVETDGVDLFKAIQKQHLEGIMAKKADSYYSIGVRSGNWLKIKAHLRQEVVIGGFTEGRRSRTYMGALLVGVYDDDGNFVYTGHTNAGMPETERKQLRQRLNKLERQTSSFLIEPKPNAPVHWVTPKLVCEVEFEEWTKEGSMRQPEFKGMRPDKDARAVHRELPKSLIPKSKKTEVEFTHLDKVFWPERGYTKGDLIEYYRSVAKYILPYLKNRPLSLLRQPNGYKDRGFFQKDMTQRLPKFAKTVAIHSESTGEDVHFLIGDNLETLLYIAQLGSIEVNPWSSTLDNLDKPDWGVLDLDPEGVGFKGVVQVAKTIHTVAEEWKVPCYPKTSGKTGIHVFFPMGADYTYAQVRDFIHLLAMEVNRRLPKLTSLERSPEKRKNKIYLDYLQNSRGQTLAAPYSVRPTKDASVSTPLHWHEVNDKLDPMKFTIKNTPARLKKEGDLWKPVLKKGVSITRVLQHLEKHSTN